MGDKQRSANETGSPCGLGRRVLCMIYDAVIVLGLLLIATAVAMPVLGPEARAGLDAALTAWLLLVWFVYLAWCWRQGGMTLGMRAWRVRLVSDLGRPVTWRQCALRFGVAFLSAAVVLAGFWWSLFDRRRRGWHDLASRTRLVRTRG